MEGECCTAGVSSSSSSSTSSAEQKRKQRQLLRELKPYRGIRMRKWGKWVAEVREPNKRSRIWLGSYVTPVAAARAYDTAVFYLRGPSARLNFPELIFRDEQPQDLSAATIRKIATEVGARADAVQRALHSSTSVSSQLPEKPDLNLFPSPETSDED